MKTQAPERAEGWWKLKMQTLNNAGVDYSGWGEGGPVEPLNAGGESSDGRGARVIIAIVLLGLGLFAAAVVWSVHDLRTQREAAAASRPADRSTAR